MQQTRNTTWPLVLLALLCVFACATPGLARTWTGADGKTVGEGEYAGVAEGNVHILLDDGDLKKVPLARLSIEDRKYVAEKLRSAERAVGGDRGMSVEPITLDKKARRWTFLVGVDDYLGTKWDLDYCVADIAALRDRLDEIGFKEANTVHLTSDGREIGTVPTKANIERRLKAMLVKVTKNDVVIVAFSGHGTNIDDQNYYCPADMDPTDKQSLLRTMVSLDTVYEQLTNCPARFELLLVDACRNNPLDSDTRAVGSAKAIRGFAKSLDDAPAGLVAMRSCLPNEESHEHPKLGHGVFMYHVLEGLRGRADRDNGNRNGRVSLMELCAYAREATSAFVRTEWGKRQTPTIEVRKEFHDFDLVDSKMLDVTVQFTVRLQDKDGPTLEDIPVALAHYDRWNDKTTVLAESRTDKSGKVELTVPYEKIDPAGTGSFLAMASCMGNTKRFTLSGFPDVRLEDLLVELPKDLTNSIGMKFKLIRAGEFMMGSSESAEVLAKRFYTEARHFEDEYPQHRVRITRPYYLGIYEVTQGQFEEVMGTSPWKGSSRKKEGSDYAASYVRWDDAKEFCRRLSAKEGKTYRLPTEAEWEYACRAGTRTAYCFGHDSSALGSYAWLEDNADDVDEDYSHRVGQKRANPWGLYDMHGNAAEWCSDWYAEDYYEGSPKYDPTGPPTGSDRVLRGGGWSLSARYCRSAARFGYQPGPVTYDLGFRVALVPSE